MDVVFERCAGIDVQKRTVVACRVLDLSGADPLRQQHEDCLRNALDRDEVVEALIAPQLQLDAGQELHFLTYAHRLARWIPSFVVEATDEHRELRAKLRHGLVRPSFIPPQPQRE